MTVVEVDIESEDAIATTVYYCQRYYYCCHICYYNTNMYMMKS